MELAVVGIAAGSGERAGEHSAWLHRAATERAAVRRYRVRHARSVGPHDGVPYGNVYLRWRKVGRAHRNIYLRRGRCLRRKRKNTCNQ